LAVFKAVYGLDKRKPVIRLVLGGIGADADPVEGLALYIPVFDDGGDPLGGQGFLYPVCPDLGGE
jgi:hypothetical protein